MEDRLEKVYKDFDKEVTDTFEVPNIFIEADRKFKETTYEPLQAHERHACINIIEDNHLKNILDKNIAEVKDIVTNAAKEKPALDIQVGGDHYKRFKIQPIEFCQKNKIPPCEFNVIKYVCRHSFKHGKEDLEKAKHCIDLLIQMEYGDENKGLQAN